MAQRSRCGRCGATVEAHSVAEDRAYYHCSCGHRWSGRRYYGHDNRKGTAIAGGIVGTVLTGGLDGGLVGAAAGWLLGGDSSKCIKCAKRR